MPPAIDHGALQRVVAIINGKGGVGKTTLTANVGGLLALGGWRVLLADLDFQGDLGRDLGYHGTDNDDDGRGLSKALQFTDDAPRILRDVRPGLDVITGGSAVEGAAAALSAKAARSGSHVAHLSVAEMLTHVANDYDIILLDCPPSNEVIQSAAVAAARYVVIPTRTDKAGIDGLASTASRFDGVIDLNPDLDLLGVIIFDSGASATSVRASAARDITARLGVDNAEDLIFTGYVRHAEAVARASRDRGLLVHELDDAFKAAPRWYERARLGWQGSVPPESSTGIADSLQAITNELTDRIMAKEAEVANV